MLNFSDEQLHDLVPPQSHLVPPLSGKRPFYLVSREEWHSEMILDRGYHGQIVPQILDFGAGERERERAIRESIR